MYLYRTPNIIPGYLGLSTKVGRPSGLIITTTLVSASINSSLEDRSLGLLALLLLQLPHIDVPPDENGSQAERNQRHTNNNHVAHDIRVRTNNGVALRCAVKESQLHLDVAEDEGCVGFAGFGEAVVQFAGNEVVPHGTSDGGADRGAEASKETPKSVDGGDFLMCDRDHDGQLGAGREDTRAETDDDLG